MGRKRKGNKIDGWLVIDKPLNMGSNQVVGKCRWLTGAQKCGHGGTLDPLATGILPIAFGEATKVIPFIQDARKIYEFTIKFGTSRSTDDLEGEIAASHDYRPSEAELLAILPDFTGKISQIPPAYSAIKVDGKRAYDLARAGEEFTLKPREVEVFSLKILDFSGDEAQLEVLCGKGTYVRSLARDIALRLGTVGHVIALRRTKVGAFDLSNAISLEKCEELVHSAPHESWILNISTVLDDILALAVTKEQAADLKMGRRFKASDLGSADLPSDGFYRLMYGEVLIALANIEEGIVKPSRVFNL